MSIFEKFNSANQVIPPQEEDQHAALVAKGEQLVDVINAAAMCLMGTLSRSNKTDDHINQAVPKEIAEHAHDMASASQTMAKQAKGAPSIAGDAVMIMTHDETKRFSPDKTWLLTIVPAIYDLHGLDPEGYIPGNGEFLLDPERKLLAYEIPPTEELVDELEAVAETFVALAEERVTDYLASPYKISGEMMYNVTLAALRNGYSVVGDIREWFEPCQQIFLEEFHTPANIPQGLKASYN